MAEAEGPSGINWNKAIKSLGIGLILYAGGWSGTYMAQAESAQETVMFRMEVREMIKKFDERLVMLEEKENDQAED